MNRFLVAAATALAAAGAAAPVIGWQAAASTSTTTGYDVSYPQCPWHFPRSAAFGIVGVNDGIAWSQNPCLAGEAAWATSRPGTAGLYMNTADPGTSSAHWTMGGPEQTSCDPANGDTTSAAFAACAYDYGWNTARDALTVEAANVPSAPSRTWWLDVETTNSWVGSAPANAGDIQGSLDYLHDAGVAVVGVYSTASQWHTITGGYAFASYTPEWLAGANSLSEAQAACSEPPFGGRASRVILSQYPARGFDADLSC
jgi:hypothetical protein